MSVFVGGTFDVPLRKGSIAASLGPSVIWTSADDVDETIWAAGGVLKLTLSTYAGLGGVSKIFQHYEYSPPEGQQGKVGCYYITECDENGRNGKDNYVCP